MFRLTALAAASALAFLTLPVAAQTHPHPSPASQKEVRAVIHYRTTKVGLYQVFYREAGDPHAPTLLLLHGFPTSSHMFRELIPLLADRYHIVAPDLPGFGFSEAPPRGGFRYSFDNLTKVIDGFTEVVGLKRYAIYVFDYGAPVGFRLALAHPERITAIISQNGNAYEEGLSQGWNPIQKYWKEPTEANRAALQGLGPLWEARKAYWANRSANEARLRANFLSLEATRLRHVGTSPNPERYDPDLWIDELAFLARSGQDQIQSDLFYDYRTN